jgi:osmotically-inducible protein OsmY
VLLGSAGCVAPLTETERSDQGITARLQERMKAERGLDLRYVTLDVHDRVVTLSGTVPSWENSRDLERVARRTRGVDQVMNNLVILEQ